MEPVVPNRFKKKEAVAPAPEFEVVQTVTEAAETSADNESATRSPRIKKERKPKSEKQQPKAEDAPGQPWWREPRVQVMSGLLMLFCSLFMAGAFTSFLFTAAEDQSTIYPNPLEPVLHSTPEVKNTFGSLGAAIASFFINNLFGLPSFLLTFMLFAAGFNLMVQRPVFTILKVMMYSFFGLIWSAAAAALLNHTLYPESAIAWGGAFGNYLTGADGELIRLIKPAGTVSLLLFSGLMFAVWIYDFHFGFLLKWFEKKPSELPVSEPLTVNDNTATVSDKPTTTDNSFRDESENIFAKDGLNEVVQPPLTDEAAGFEVIEKADEAKTTETEVPAHQELDLEMAKTIEEPEAEENHQPTTPYDPTLDLSNYRYPSVELMEEYGSEKIKFDQEELERNKNQIIETLNNYQIEISKIKATIGPTVTLYEIVPAPGVRISKIKNLEDDVALSLAALGIRIIAPMPGKGTIGIEVPNTHKEVVSMRSLLASEKFQNSSADLPICLGKSISNEIYIGDLAKMPHLLMAGATGQGKSVGINSIIVSLLYKKHPSQLKFVLVDPKKVELSLYETLEKHFLAKLPGEEDAIITDTKKVVTTLNALCMEMDARYDLLKSASVRNIKEYNAKFINRHLNPQNGHRFMPYIVLIIDEFADLIMTAGKEVEMPIARLAQLARAIGIHLILATQRPSVNIITGTIKANFPARIAFKTSSKIDSRTILDTGGAEQLIGRGDLLLSVGSDVLRLQCGFVDTPEVERIRDFISNQQGYSEAFQLPEYKDPNAAGDDDFVIDGERDEMFDDAARIIVQNQLGSTSLIQRRLKLGYNRAGRLMDQLQEAGIVGENLGTKAREVKFRTEQELEQYLQKLKA